jgi:predicted GNAT superfamily acetyltransferase
MPDDIIIRRAESIADYLACQAAQRLAWGIVDDSYVVPLATLVGANRHGGLVLGAFDASGDAVGVSFAFLGKVEGRPCLYSQLTGVVPGQQGNGLGYRLKQAQRDFACAEGIPRLAWSFDPLQAGNARFNLDKLGATCAHYVVDMYGRRTDALSAGGPTDRLIAEWPTEPEILKVFMLDDQEITGLPRLIEMVESGPRVVDDSARPSDLTLLEIPSEIVTLRRQDPELAEAWALAVRGAFQAAFEAGYRAEGFVREPSDGVTRCFYVMKRD